MALLVRRKASLCYVIFSFQFQLKGNVSYQTALPPNEVVIKGVAEFLKDKDLTDIESLASEVFKESGYDMKEATTKLKETVEYYKSLLERKDYSSCKLKGDLIMLRHEFRNKNLKLYYVLSWKHEGLSVLYSCLICFKLTA